MHRADAMMQPMTAPNVVFILATNYSGSHLLAQLLAAHPACAGVGELHNYHKFRGRGSRSGNVVDDYTEHPAFGGLTDLPVGRWHEQLLERLGAEHPGLSHLVDNSKRPAWARRFRGTNAYHVHLLRDPRAMVSRWLRTYDTDPAARSQRRRVLRRQPWLLGRLADPVAVYIEKWLMANRAITKFLLRRRSALATYRDLAIAPQPTLTALMPQLGLAFDEAQLRYGEATANLGTRKREYLDAARDSAISIDLRWQEHLSPTQRLLIERHGGIRRYLEDLGLQWTRDGLTAGRAGSNAG